MEKIIDQSVHDLTVFKLHFGKLTLKGYTKGEHVLRFEAIVHNTADLHCGRVIERFPQLAMLCDQFDIDLSKDLIPIHPATHYMIGGVECDLDGRTTLSGLSWKMILSLLPPSALPINW